MFLFSTPETESTMTAESLCWEWHCAEIDAFYSEILAADEELPTCPCTLMQANIDGQFIVDNSTGCATSSYAFFTYARVSWEVSNIIMANVMMISDTVFS